MDEKYSSDSESSDDDYRPEIDGDESGASCCSDSDTESSVKKKKNADVDCLLKDDVDHTNIVQNRRNNRKSRKNSSDKDNDRNEELGKIIDNPMDEAEERKKADSLWGDFLKEDKSSKETALPPSTADDPPTSVVPPVVRLKPKDEPTLNRSTPPASSTLNLDRKRPPFMLGKRPATAGGGGGGGGLGSILGQLSKKNKVSTLDKSKQDWNSFKQSEGIVEELQTHNKGRDGYLDRQDFLERTDFRQFEIEKGLRLKKPHLDK